MKKITCLIKQFYQIFTGTFFTITLCLSFAFLLSTPIQAVSLGQGIACKIIAKHTLDWEPTNTRLVGSSPVGIVISNEKDGRVQYAIGGIFGFNVL